jgi:hypothetical protein
MSQREGGERGGPAQGCNSQLLSGHVGLQIHIIMMQSVQLAHMQLLYRHKITLHVAEMPCIHDLVPAKV